jgi:hypothetical protein
LENLCQEIEKLKRPQTRTESQESGLKSVGLEIENLRLEVENLKKFFTSSPKPEKSLKKPDFPLKGANSLEGIISYLTKKHGGNVDEKGIVTITSKSIDPRGALKNVADLTSYVWFLSNDEPGQWICWDFHKMRLCPTHYTIRTYELKSWVVEASLDGENWTEIDRKTNNQDFKNMNTVSFSVSKPVESRFIRLTQTGKRHCGDDILDLYAVEFFGTLSE